MSSHKRSCSSCKFFNDSPLPGNGWCTHPKRQLTSEVRILVRKGELACRDSWGGDYWVSTTATSRIEQSVGQPLPDRLVAGPGPDDQVTSVTSSLAAESSDPSRSGGRTLSHEPVRDDVIVSQPSMLPEAAEPSAQDRSHERDDLNLPAQEDQQERVRVIARGNRDAIVRARERAVLRRDGSGQASAGSTSDLDIGDVASNGRGDDLPDNVIESDRFAALADEPVTRRALRSSRTHRSDQGFQSRGYADPTPPVPADEVSNRSRQSWLVSRRADADRFESVPEVKPDVALPELRRFLQADSADSGGHAGSPTGDSDEQPETSYDRVLQRARTIKTEARKERDARIIRNRPATRQATTPRSASLPVPANIGDRVPALASPVSTTEYLRHEIEDDQADNESLRGIDYVMPDVDLRDDAGLAAGRTDAAFDDDDYFDDEFHPGDDVTYGHNPERLRNEPRTSWWRGLTVGFSRRPGTHAEPAITSVYADDSDDEWSDDDEFTTASSWSDDNEFEATSASSLEFDDYQDEDPGIESEPDRSPERVFSFARHQRPSAEPIRTLRDSRAAEEELIDYELTDEVLETSFADDTDRVQSEAWREDGRDVAADREREAAYADRSRPDSGFTLDDQHDLDAFRAALFRNSSADVIEPRRNRARQGRSQREREPGPVPRKEIAASRRELPVEPAMPPAPHQRYVEEPAFDIRDFVEQDADLLDMSVQIAPDVPRACHTCRDFRPSESGERGWCTNDFAFAHRQMVNADDLPCQSSIGCWWLPGDGAWMPGGDLAARENPTPLTDRLVARRNGRETADDQGQTGLYVREM